MNEEISKTLDKMVKDRTLRVNTTRRSHFWFFFFYFTHYIKHETAPFQLEILKLTEDETIENLFIVSFRGSAKSTIITMSYAIWSILGVQQKKYVVIFSQTMTQAKQHMLNLKSELEGNELLRNDLGPFREENVSWALGALTFSKYGAKIIIASMEQSFRGFSNREHRPDLIICDDIENLESTRTREGRNKTFEKITGEILPSGGPGTRLIIIGNLLHPDSALMRLKKRIDDKEMDGIFKFYPLIGENGKILWPGKFPNMEAVEKEHRRVANEVAWQREYLLRIIMGNDQVVDFEWIQYYEKLPEEKCRKTYVGVDPAFAEGEEADCTAIVWAKVYGRGENLRIYICPDPINQRMNFPEAIEKIKTTVDILKLEHYNVKLFVEQAGGQLSFIYQLNSMKCKTTGITVSTDKKFRLATVSNLIKNGTILFAKQGNEDLIEQMIDFGKGHDDLVDAFTLIIHQIIRENTSGLGIS